MRSSKSRSRNKGRSRSPMGNIVNRVFDSSGPEGKVRGTPQQIIEKYAQLARDAQLSNDRIAAENFLQHSEHYTRMLGEAQREQEARRESHEAQQNQQAAQRTETQGPRDTQSAVDPGSAPQPEPTPVQGLGDQPEVPQALGPAKGGDVIDLGPEAATESDTGLVDTPETAPKPKRRTRSRKTTKGAEGAEAGDAEQTPAEKEKPKRTRKSAKADPQEAVAASEEAPQADPNGGAEAAE